MTKRLGLSLGCLSFVQMLEVEFELPTCVEESSITVFEATGEEATSLESEFKSPKYQEESETIPPEATEDEAGLDAVEIKLPEYVEESTITMPEVMQGGSVGDEGKGVSGGVEEVGVGMKKEPIANWTSSRLSYSVVLTVIRTGGAEEARRLVYCTAASHCVCVSRRFIQTLCTCVVMS